MPSHFVLDGRYIQDHFPGIGRYTFNLIDALARVAPNDQFTMLHNPALKNTHYSIAALAQHPNVKLQRIDVPTFSLAEQYQLFATRHATRQFALFHSPYYIKPYFLRVPSAVTIFDLIPIRFPNAVPSARARIFFRWLVALAARTAVRVIVPSQATRDDLVTLLRVPSEKISVIPLAADPRFAPQPQTAITRIREKYALPNDYVLYVGINKPHKNLSTLIAAFEQFAARHLPLTTHLVIAGAHDPRYAPTQSAIGNQQSAIHFIRNIDDADLPALYAGAVVFVFPSVYEGFGLPPLEAMACGTPVISSNASSLPEVVGDAALLVNPFDAENMAAAIARVINNSALREELRAKSLVRAAHFSWEHTARETLRIYESILEIP